MRDVAKYLKRRIQVVIISFKKLREQLYDLVNVWSWSRPLPVLAGNNRVYYYIPELVMVQTTVDPCNELLRKAILYQHGCVLGSCFRGVFPQQ